MKNSIKIKNGKLGGLILYINGIKVNFGGCEFATLSALRNYWDNYRTLLVSGFRHDNLSDYLKANK